MFSYFTKLYSSENDNYLENHKAKYKYVLTEIKNKNMKVYPIFKKRNIVYSILLERRQAAKIIQKIYRNYKRNEIFNLKKKNEYLFKKLNKLQSNYTNLQNDVHELRYELGLYINRAIDIEDDMERIYQKVHEIEFISCNDFSFH